ncbi:13324_t:CDS:10 [Racocetra fulgida]|uniref:13324_t:CDS:1 n=1 Tax=Racocetra fulgida TaxID=60492 RepID=A0A9N8ZKQ5_9GLOM|nr:13324_t:CDS:10 [Racocetra fulgida]
MNKYNGKPLAVLKEEIEKEYIKTREEFYDARQLENKALVRESSTKVQALLLQCDKSVKEIRSNFRGDPYPPFENLPVTKVKSNTNNAGHSKAPAKGRPPSLKIDLNVQDYLSTTHRKKRSDKRLAISIPIQSEIPKYALWTPITRSSKTEDDPVLRHLYYFGEDSEDDDDVDYFDVYEESIVGKNAYDLEAKLEGPKSSKTSTAPLTTSTTSRIARLPVIENRASPTDNNDENMDVSFIEVTLKVLAKFLKGKDIKKMVSTDFRPSGNKKRPRPPISKTKPCGSNCYIHFKEDSQDAYMTDSWDDVEIALFEKAGYLMGIKNYCSVATIVMTKTCEQLLGEIDKDDEHIEIGSSSDDPRKKGKKMAKMEYHPCDHPGRPCDTSCPCRQGNVRGDFQDATVQALGNRAAIEHAFVLLITVNVILIYADVQPQRTIVGKSTVAGWGLFVREPVKKNEYLGEYIGEVPESDDVQVVELQVPSSTAESSASRSPSPAYSTHTANNNDIIESEPILEHSKDTASTDNEPENDNGNSRFPILSSTKKQTAPATLPVVTDGVFSNLSAKPDTETNKEDENPPSYETAAADATPPYWETTVIAPGLCGDEVLVEGLPVQNEFIDSKSAMDLADIYITDFKNNNLL